MALDEFSFPGSSNLESGTFDDATGILTVAFQGGGRYAGKVPRSIVDGLKGAPSPGQYYWRQIRGRYRMERA